MCTSEFVSCAQVGPLPSGETEHVLTIFRSIHVEYPKSGFFLTKLIVCIIFSTSTVFYISRLCSSILSMVFWVRPANSARSGFPYRGFLTMHSRSPGLT